MSVSYLFSKSKTNKIGSRAISYFTNFLVPDLNPCSHVAIKVNDLVFESTLTSGVRIVLYDNWIKTNTVVYTVNCVDKIDHYVVLKKAMDITYDKKYDWMGILYFAKCIISKLLFDIDIPKVNKWQSEQRYFCVELIESITGKKYSMITPIQLVSEWKDSGREVIEFNDIN